MMSAALRILIVDDNAVNRMILLSMLKHLGYSADTAINGHEALQFLEHQPYDLVLMDIQMPELDGIQTTQIIRQHSPSKDRPFIIAVTAYADEFDREICINAGMNDYMSKPIRFDELRSYLQVSFIELSE